MLGRGTALVDDIRDAEIGADLHGALMQHVRLGQHGRARQRADEQRVHAEAGQQHGRGQAATDDQDVSTQISHRALRSGPFLLRQSRHAMTHDPCEWAMSAARSSGSMNDGGTGGPQLYRARMSVNASGFQSASSTMQSRSL